jgi:transcriptional regulator with XRE-family HTH domain
MDRMPRPNPPRPLRGEANLARRIAYERHRAGMSMESLAKRMTDLGCPINQSAIWKIENADPPRRITYDEALAFADAFEVPLAELSVAPEIVADLTALQLLDEYRRARLDAVFAFDALRRHVDAHPRARAAIDWYASEQPDDRSREAIVEVATDLDATPPGGDREQR